MTHNYLKRHIEAFFTESTAINANLNVIDILVSARRDQLKIDFPSQGYTLFRMMTNYRDLSQIDGGNNLYDTGNRYELNTDNLEDETIRLLSYVSCLTISQIFEVFESYLKNILSEAAFQKPNLLKKLRLELIDNRLDTIRGSIYKIQEKNNKGLIKGLKKISLFFKSHEQDNIWNLNMGEWYNLIAMIRHIVTHQRQVVDDKFYKYLKEDGLNKIFEKHFSIKNNLLILTPYQANLIIDLLYQYAHLIYKGVSSDLELDMDFKFKPCGNA